MAGIHFFRTAILALILSAVALLAAPTVRAHVGDPEVTIDFSSYGAYGTFDTDFYRADGITFPPERCGDAGCLPWVVGMVQDDFALQVDPTSFGHISSTFTRPVSDLSLRVAPTLQGTATYILTALSASGEPLGSSSVTVTQDFGDPANTGFGYFTIGLDNLPHPAKGFTLSNVFVRSSFPLNTYVGYGVSSIWYRHWGGQPVDVTG